MAIHDPKANTGLLDPPKDDERFMDLICPQIHFLVSQLRQRGRLSPEEIGQ